MAIVIPIVTEYNPKGVDRALASIGKAEGTMGKIGAGFKAALVPATIAFGAVTALGVDFAKAAMEDQKAADLLADALRRNTGASDESIASVERWVTAQGQALGVSDDQLRPALATLARATGDVGKAQDLASLAMDVSAASGKDLGSVSAALAKAYAGNTTALGKLLPGIDKTILKSGDFSKVQAELARTMGGTAAVAAETTAGKMERLGVAMQETKESIGAALLPVLDQLLPSLSGIAGFVQDNSTAFVALGVAVAAVSGFVIAMNAAMAAYAAIQAVVKIATVAWTAVQWLLNIALAANPIGLVIIAIVAIIAVIVLLWMKCETFRNIVTAVWNAVLAVVKKVVDWFNASAKPLIVSFIQTQIAAFRNLWSMVQSVWSGIQSAISAVISWFQAYVAPVIGSVAGAISSAFEGMASTVSSIWQGVQSTVEGIVSWISDKIATVRGWLSNIPGLSTLVGAKAPGTFAIAIPSQLRAGGSSLALAGGSAGGPTIVVNGALDPDAVGRQIERLLAGHRSRVGRDVSAPRASAW